MMGGNALSVATTRIDAPTYHHLASMVTQSLRDTFGVRAQDIPAFRNKPDFGDLDVVVEHDLDSHKKILGQSYYHDNLMQWATQHGHAREFAPNNSILSFDWRASPQDEQGFQVDLLLAAPEDFDSTISYFSYNDLGNLVGRIAHKMGMIYGHQGLLYPVMFGDHLFRTLVVSKDTDVILDVLGYDPSSFRKGFDTLDQVMDYAMSSPYFNPDIYLLENRNHAARTRDRKRKTYQQFLERIAQTPCPHPYQFPEDKSLWLPKFFERFPDFHQEWKQAQQDRAHGELIKQHFNGKNVGLWSDLTGKELGGLMKDVRQGFASDQELVQFIHTSGEEGLSDRVMQSLASRRPKPKMG